MPDIDASSAPESLHLLENSPCFHNDLPVELWIKVLEYLNLDDLLASSRTCRRWNTWIATNPQLWSEFRITSPHDSFQGFLNLDAPDGGYAIPSSVSSRLALEVPGMPSGSVFTITRLKFLLCRSTSPSLSICVVLHSDVSRHFIQSLSHALLPHIHRVHELRIFHTTPSPALRLLDNLVPLAVIRGLWLYTPGDVEGGRSTRWGGLEHGVFKMHHLVYGQPSCFPCLTDLKTSFSVTWPEPIAPLRSLRSLSMVVHKFDSLLNALMSCPFLDTLDVNMRFTWPGKLRDFMFDEELLERVSRISTVRLENVDLSHRKSILELFDDPQREVYELNMNWRSSNSWGTGIACLTGVLFDVPYPTVVRCTLSDDVYSFMCGDDAGQSRVLTFPDCYNSCKRARRLLQEIDTDYLRRASLPLTIWLTLADEFHLPCSLEVLELSFAENGLDSETDFPLDIFGGIDNEGDMYGGESAQLRQHMSQHDSDWDEAEIDQPDERTIRIRFTNPHGIDSDTGIPPPVNQVLQYLSILALKPNADLLHARVELDNQIGVAEKID